MEQIVSFAESVKEPTLRKLWEGINGQDYVKERIAKAERAPAELDKLQRAFRERFGDLFPDVSVGQFMPEFAFESVAGKPASLRALRGNVVVLDIWATWCPPCNGMIPHEREMVERLKHKSFVLVNISIDEKKQALNEFLAESMPWTHWWSSDAEGFTRAWQVRSVPTIYVLDAQGVIRVQRQSARRGARESRERFACRTNQTEGGRCVELVAPSPDQARVFSGAI